MVHTKATQLQSDLNSEYIKDGYLEIGLELSIVATVKSGDLIEATIKPSLRRKIGDKQSSIDSPNSFPIIDAKEIKTTFTLNSGQTVAIGGLTSTQDDLVEERVPVLGSIPVLGRLFSYKNKEKRQTETIIFVTLTIADPQSLMNHSGIPSDSTLIHKRLAREQAGEMIAEENESDAKIDDESKSRLIRGPRR